MKSLTIVITMLVVTLILNGPIQSYADPQLDTLVNIATQARNNLNISISQISNVPDEITHLYNQGSNETDALIKAVNSQDIASAKQHFLSAMNFFKATNYKINSLNATETNDQQRADVAKLQSEITRLKKIAETLRTIVITNHADFVFTPFDTSIQQAKQALDAGKINEASKSIDAANQLIISAHHALSKIAQERTSYRAKDFTEKQIERFNKMSDLNATQNPAMQVSNITISKTSSNLTSIENPREMIAKLRKLVAEGNVDEALKIIKSLDMYQKETLKNSGGTIQSQPQTTTMQNNTNSNPLPTTSNVTSSNPVMTNSSNNDNSNQIGGEDKKTNTTNSYRSDNPNQMNKDKKIDKIEHQVIQQGNADSQQQDKTQKKNHEKTREKLNYEKQNRN